MIKRVLVCAMVGVLCGQPARAEDGENVRRLEERIKALEGENGALKKKVQWYQLLSNADLRSSATVVHRFPLSPGSRQVERTPEYLEGIRLPESAAKDEVRRYVATILGRAAKYRTSYSGDDPEIDLLEKVGGANADLLVEPLVVLPHLAGSPYLVEALKAVIGDQHKKLILDNLPDCQELAEIVVAKGWTADAAPTLLRVLAERSPYLFTDWVEAAAPIARPENYDDLKFQLANGSNPFHVWKAIRGLPGMEPLDECIERTWRASTRKRGSWEWREFAVVAAHYGHFDAMEVLVQGLGERYVWWWEAFQTLTGFGVGREDVDREKDAQEWFATHKDQLVFDRSQRRYNVAK
jgi:hypothetical protein